MVHHNHQQKEPVDYTIYDVDENDDDLELFEPLPLDADETSVSELFALSAFITNDCSNFCNNSISSINNTSNDDDNNNSNSHNKRRKKKKNPQHEHRVSFDDHPTTIHVPSFACLGEGERRLLWYRQVEIERFRAAARHACRQLRQNPFAYPQDITRGLELRTSLDRQYRKHLALTCILQAQDRYGPKIDPYHLAAIAGRCTEVPLQEALDQGTRDFCAVYDDDDNNNNKFRWNTTILPSNCGLWKPTTTCNTSCTATTTTADFSGVTEEADRHCHGERKWEIFQVDEDDDDQIHLAKRHCNMMNYVGINNCISSDEDLLPFPLVFH